MLERLWSFGMVATKYDSDGVVASLNATFCVKEDLDELNPPVPIPFIAQRTFMAFLDKLTLSEQMTLKVASALCLGKKGEPIFEISALLAVHPYKSNDDFDVQGDLKRFIEIGLIKPYQHDSSASVISFLSPSTYILSPDLASACSEPSTSTINSDLTKTVFLTLKSSSSTEILLKQAVVWFPTVETPNSIDPLSLYAFRHGFLCDLLYDNMLHQQRHRLHMKVFIF